MIKTYISDIKVGEINKLQGFAENVRDKKSMAFIVLSDITGKLQLTIEKGKNEELDNLISQITPHSCITVEGEVIKNDFVKLNGIEMLPTSIKIESVADALPIGADASIDLRLDYRYIDLRNEKNQLIFKVQSYMTECFRDFLYSRNFTEIHTPKLIGTASESGSEVFEVKYFDKKAYLAQSPQFYKQMALCAGFDRVFEQGPVFRAEKSFTYKHATEFTGFDLEFAGIDSYRDVMKMEEELLTEMLTKVKAKYGEKIKEIFGFEVIVPTAPFPVIDLNDLYKDLNEMYGYKTPEEEKGDLPAEAERLCKQYSMEKFGSEFLFVTGFSASKRAFYHMRDENGVPLGYDLIWKGCEITTGAQREHRFEILKNQAEEKGLSKDVEFYLQFFKYGCPPHGGFGLGLDRMIMIMLNLSSIKEAEFIFRGPNRLNP